MTRRQRGKRQFCHTGRLRLPQLLLETLPNPESWDDAALEPHVLEYRAAV